ncbi:MULTISPECIES: ABC transporter ATP-binding protein [unclassified Bradyrhizobium]|uniref:ABC transporter ATP-binding protein n=1 Tax=unclassified Bradyrhizobium TaxID=2631580 RepID=UPI001BAD5557|nr:MULTISPECIES: ABC transporter ATP-binding protein [unclassified Bradyrhizobium]MBR1206058.1 ABC transporter ATP-binding protein [Bradyrhizobium sp. AUGA SZCCT0124]MBR1314816.1 ABC transporter ATP-binding protein [Bradyrhizobium sp. AUGA SZCCT0051]MBR1341787.1 ABC transporter ATP-binding protein [Bradyrhizobium sp. AUGA SZCCT0105]MBR1358812.1 ABC transporter ATP-binding protein [Bradyrhizobium sp. AUGA SZCCT0045]
MTALLEVKNLSKSFGGLVAVNDVSFALEAGRITALIGPNGAGKTTCFNLVAGAMRPTSGQVVFEGHPIENAPPELVCRMGIARTFQIVRPMRDMSVLENAMVGAFSWTRNVSEARSTAYESLESVGLAGKANARTDQLTLPDRKMLETAKALSTRPRLLLLDEVMAGLRPTEAAGVVRVLRKLAEGGLTILLVEHVMRIVMEVASRVVVLHHGAKIAEGRPEEVVADPMVLESYLGAGFHA